MHVHLKKSHKDTTQLQRQATKPRRVTRLQIHEMTKQNDVTLQRRCESESTNSRKRKKKRVQQRVAVIIVKNLIPVTF